MTFVERVQRRVVPAVPEFDVEHDRILIARLVSALEQRRVGNEPSSSTPHFRGAGAAGRGGGRRWLG
jgi:hypothetical protein